MATNLLPKVLISHEPCFLEYQYIGEQFKKIIKTVLDLLVNLHPAKEASTYALIMNSFPFGLGALLGTTSLSFP